MDVPNDQLLLMKSWISECENAHPACTAKEDGFRPTRLLDLRKFGDSRDLALISTADSPRENAHYITLSHGWDRSGRGSFTTISTNIDQRLRCILFDELPLTFQDAVDITRKLDIRYLWIDSLCIVQDQPEDVKKETAAMGQVYGQSYCTLAAASSRNEHEGCRVNADKNAKKEPFRYLDIELHTERVRFFETMPCYWGDQYRCGPLRKRAWALPERLLSRRVLHFSQDILWWECQTMRATEELPWAQPKVKGTFPGWLYNASHEFAVGDSRSLELRQSWCRVVEDYTTRVLQSERRERDKLPVLSGLAQRYQESCLRGRYVAGLWESDLPSALLWQTRKPQELMGGGSTDVREPRRPVQYRAPSWSWPAVEGAVAYESQLLGGSWAGNSPSDMRDLVRRDPADEVDFRDLRITEIVLSARGADPAGALSDGYMCLTGRLKRAVFSSAVIHDEEWDFDEEGKELWGPGGEIVGIMFPDVSGELRDKDEVFCLRIRTEHEHCNSLPPERMGCYKKGGGFLVGLWMGLALVKTGEAENAYRRVGLVRFMRDPWFDDVEPTELLIF